MSAPLSKEAWICSRSAAEMRGSFAGESCTVVIQARPKPAQMAALRRKTQGQPKAEAMRAEVAVLIMRPPFCPASAPYTLQVSHYGKSDQSEKAPTPLQIVLCTRVRSFTGAQEAMSLCRDGFRSACATPIGTSTK